MSDKTETPCEGADCGVLCTGRFCGNACRAKAWKARTGYKDARSVRNARQGRSRPSRRRRQTRYALVELKGSVLEILGFKQATSKRAVERAFGITDRDDLVAVAARHIGVEDPTT